MSSPFESLEARQLCTFTALDADFGIGGRAAVVSVDINGSGGRLTTTRLADGRLIVADNVALRYLRGDGSVDTRRAFEGLRAIVQPGGRVEQIVVDAKTGRTAVLHVGHSPTDNAYVELFDAFGRRTAKRVIGPAENAKVAFDVNGGLVVARSTSVTVSFRKLFTVHLQRFNASGVPVGVHNGLITSFQYADNAGDSNNDSYVRSLHVDDAGRLYLVTRAVSTSQGDMLTDESIELRRFSASGVYDTAYAGGSSNPVALFTGHSDDFNTRDVTVHDIQVRDDGTLYTLMSTVSWSSEFATTRGAMSLTRLDAVNAAVGGKSVAVGASPGLGQRYRNPELAILNDGTLLISALVGAGTHVFRMNATTLENTPGWSDFGSFRQTTRSDTEGGTLAAGADGQFLITHRYRSSIVAYDLDADFKSPPAGRAVLAADGTLIVSGTSKSDTIQIRTKQGNVLVEYNGKASKFPSASVHGLLVQGNNGNDRIDVVGAARWLFAAYLEGGAGNDTLVGGDRADTLVAGSGNDSLVGGFDNDYLYGQDGRDTLYGNAGLDVIYGGRDNDFIAPHTTSHVNDSASDTLFGGSGVDTFIRETSNPYQDEEDVYYGRESSDRFQ